MKLYKVYVRKKSGLLRWIYEYMKMKKMWDGEDQEKEKS